MPRKAKQRFVGLDVGEVSLVDRPANESEFAVIKKLTGGADMAAENKTQEDVDTVSVEQPITDNAVAKALASTAEIVKSAVGAVQEAKKAAEPAATPADEPTDAEVEAEVEKAAPGMRKQMEAEMAKKGLKGDMLKAAVNVAMRGMRGSFAKTSKAAGDDDEGERHAAASADDIGSLVAAEVAKQVAATKETAKAEATPTLEEAQKAFAEAMEKAQKALNTMMAMGVATGTPKTTVPSNATFGGSQVKDLTKSVDDTAGAVKDLVDTIKSLSERVSKVEKARMPAQGDGDAEQPVKKANSLWSGIV